MDGVPSFLRRLGGWLAGSSAPPPAAPGRRESYAYLGNGRAVTLTHRGHQLMLDATDIGMTPHLALRGEWERVVEDAVLALLAPGAAVVEVGANIGYHTLAMSAAIGAAGRLHAFEPNPRLVPLLSASVALNGFNDRVTIHPRAAADAPGQVALLVHPDHAGSGHLEVAAVGPGYTQRHEIETVRIDDAVGEGFGPARLMRLDCEGAEPLALRGAEALIRRSPDLVLVMEWSVPMMRARADVAAFATWLEGLGLNHAWRIEAGGRASVAMADLPGLPHSEVILARRPL
ncbi:FkbM family methyltransferase [Roseomonas sp. PWR1]|uniref:FkbM family methyltransferase n=1 Tax=Roseomonas nitratireducens TaxID=2820810 RepID=A0ABS4AUD1_9PROT|nr:FkbM family methyltransferase [Neoroseomonas nitratireducens]MBP0464971.1 FkbM family methyltransferase [Neoroseomonas nitratireducens]